MKHSASLLPEFSDASGSYYEATASRGPPAPPLTGSTRVDVTVVGGGYAGLSSALELAKRGYRVALLEAQTVGWGASGRNGGQVIVGYAGQAAINRQLSPADARHAWDLSVEAVQLLRQHIRDHDIDCDYVDGHLTLATTQRKSAALAEWVEHLATAYGYALEPVPQDDIGDWVASQHYVSGALDRQSGHFHPLRFCLGLARAAIDAGVAIYQHSPVRRIERGTTLTLKTDAGEAVSDLAVLACNAYVGAYGNLAPVLLRKILLVGTHVIATEPLEHGLAQALVRSRAAAADTNFILDYFRVTADDRLLFGGADVFSNDMPRDPTRAVHERLIHVFPQLSEAAIAYSWSGIVDATINNAPDFGRIEPRIYYLQGFSGHGVALANLAGKLVAEVISGQAERFDILARVKHLQFPRHAGARRTAISLGVLFNQIRDQL